jgi:hypothetical protein
MKRTSSIRTRKTPKQPPTEAGAKAAILPEPRVLHGHTLTKEVSFRDVCHAIRDSAFLESDLPLIVSLEVHAGLDQQQTMVEIMRDAWKDLLVDINTIANGSTVDCALPRLQDLKRKILIKVKWAPPGLKAADNMEQKDAIIEAERDLKNAELDDENSLSMKQSAPTKQKPSKIFQGLSELAIYTKAYHFSHFNQEGILQSYLAVPKVFANTGYGQ